MSASDKQLGALHQKLAEVLSEALDGQVVEGYEDPETGEVQEAMNIPPSASILTVAAKFLKDNDVTCDVEQNDTVAAMRNKLVANKARLSASDKAAIADTANYMGSA